MNDIISPSRSQRPVTIPRSRGAPVLPGAIRYVTGTARDLEPLSRFHYARSRPATFADVRVALYDDPLRGVRAIGIGILSWPVPNVPARLRYFQLDPKRRRENLAFANAHVRTISRIIVHPQFRSAGVASALVRQLIDRCPTRYVETIAQMGAIHPVFLVCDMRRLNEGHDTEKPYFLIDREQKTAPSRSRLVDGSPDPQPLRTPIASTLQSTPERATTPDASTSRDREGAVCVTDPTTIAATCSSSDPRPTARNASTSRDREGAVFFTLTPGSAS